MAKREAEWSREFSKVLRAQGALTYPNIASQWSPAGWPDLHVVHRMWTGLVERKALMTRIEPSQVQMIIEINRRRPMHAVIARHVGEGDIITVSTYDPEERMLFTCAYHDFLRRMKETCES